MNEPITVPVQNQHAKNILDGPKNNDPSCHTDPSSHDDSEHLSTQNSSIPLNHGDNPASQTPDSPSIASQHPELAAHYRDFSLIGSGAQATVLKASALNGNSVAIKAYDLKSIASLKEIELFERETQTLKNIEFPGVPKFIESLHTNRFLYLVEEFIDAPSLESKIQSGIRYNIDQIITILNNALNILDALSSQVPPIVHRDIKPANILINDNLDVFLVDFGVVAAQTQKTLNSTFAGTPGYLAPEQIHGKVSPATDIYSLGVTLIHLISGKSPCDMNTDGLDLDFTPYMPPHIPEWFNLILKVMVRANPKYRFESAQQVLQALKKGHTQLTFDKIHNKNKKDLKKLFKTPAKAALLSYLIGTFTFLDGKPSDLLFFQYIAPFAVCTIYLGICRLITQKPLFSSRENIFWIACMGLICTVLSMAELLPGNIQSDNIHIIGYTALYFIMTYWTMLYTDRLTEGRTGAYILFDYFAAIGAALSGIFQRIRRIFHAIADSISVSSDANAPKTKSNALAAAISIGIAIPILILAASLLSDADQNFAKFIQNVGSFLQNIPSDPPEFLRILLLATLFGIPLSAMGYGLIANCAISDHSTFSAKNIAQTAKSLRMIPAKAMTIILGAFIVLYLLFFVSKTEYLFGAFSGIVPDVLTASEYANGSFDQLIKVMFINFGLFAATAKAVPSPLPENRSLRITASILLVESAFLAVTAASPLILYISRFGMTCARFAAFWLIFTLFAACILGLLHIKKNIRVVDKLIWTAAGSFAIFIMISILMMLNQTA